MGGRGGGGAKRQMTFQTSLSVLDTTERFEHILSGKMIHLFLFHCFFLLLYTEQQGIQAINDAISDYHNYTCVKFVARTTEKNYVRFIQGTG